MLLSVFHYCFCVFILRCCRSFNPSLCRLSPFLLPSVAVSRPCLLVELQPNRPKESGQNKCNQRRPTEGLSYTNCCMGLVGLKSENEKRKCEKKTIPLMFCMSLSIISLHCQKNYGLVWNVTHLHPLFRGGRISLPHSLHVRGWRRMTFQTTYGYLRSWSRD